MYTLTFLKQRLSDLKRQLEFLNDKKPFDSSVDRYERMNTNKEIVELSIEADCIQCAIDSIVDRMSMLSQGE